MTGVLAHTADDRFFRQQFSTQSIEMQKDGQTKQPRAAAVTLGDSDVLDRKKESVMISSQPAHQRRRPNQSSRGLRVEDAVRSSMFTAAWNARLSAGPSMRARYRLRIAMLSDRRAW